MKGFFKIEVLFLNLKELEHFVAVVKYNGFSRAASNIFVSQPTLSKSIKKLEETLNVVLFERSTRQLSLTDAGKLVYNKANKIINATEELKTSLDDLLNIPSGTIKFGVPPLIGALFFPEIAKDFEQTNPNITLQLVEHGAKRIEYLVDDGQVDLGLVVLPVNEKKFSITPFINEKFKLFVHANHPLANRSIIDLEELVDESFILFTREFSLHHLIKNFCEKQANFHPKTAYESSQWDVITGLVSVGLGVTLLPESTATMVDKEEIKSIPIKTPPIWSLGVITRKNRYLSHAVRSFIEFLKTKNNK